MAFHCFIFKSPVLNFLSQAFSPDFPQRLIFINCQAWNNPELVGMVNWFEWGLDSYLDGSDHLLQKKSLIKKYWTCVYLDVSWCTYRGQRTTYRTQFSPFTKWVLGIELMPAGLAANAFPPPLSSPLSHLTGLTSNKVILFIPHVPINSHSGRLAGITLVLDEECFWVSLPKVYSQRHRSKTLVWVSVVLGHFKEKAVLSTIFFFIFTLNIPVSVPLE